jgi:hypothetical protein
MCRFHLEHHNRSGDVKACKLNVFISLTECISLLPEAVVPYQ